MSFFKKKIIFFGKKWVFGIFKNFVFWVFCGPFWVFEILKNVFGMRTGDFGGVCLVTFIHILNFWFFEFFGFLGFFGSFLSFWNFRKCFWNENGWLWGGQFSEIYSFESYLYDFWILEAGKLFFEKYYFFLIFVSPAPDELGI